MTSALELTPSLLELRDLCRGLAGELRPHALDVDATPGEISGLRSCEALEFVRLLDFPKDFRAREIPACAEAYTGSALARVIVNLELAAGGDVSVMNTCPAPSLAGLAVQALGDDKQRELFFRDVSENRSWTFFGMTEPNHGSDATAMETRLDPEPDGDGYRLNGTKRYVSNAERGAIGVVFARTGRTPLSIRALMLRRPTPGFTAEALEMTGLRGARIGHMEFDDAPVARDMVLGQHLRASRRGMWGAVRAFNVVRLQIGAQALGAAFAIRDYVCAQRPGWSGHELMSARLDAARELIYRCAYEVDQVPDGRLAPSIAKLHTTALGVEATQWAEASLGPGSLLEHPLLEKWCRDVCAFEFMDGTSNILRLTIAGTDATLARAQA